MCTALLATDADGSVLLAFNRDERVTRLSARPPQRFVQQGRTCIAPTDGDAGGTWVTINDHGLCLCLLNAYPLGPLSLFFQTPRPTSRGQLLRDLAHCDSLKTVDRALKDALGRETQTAPLKILVAAPEDRERVGEYAWNGRSLRFRSYPLPLLLVSTPFSPRSTQRKRYHAMTPWLERLKTEGGDAACLTLRAAFSNHLPSKGKESVCMHRPQATTVSTTIIRMAATSTQMWYFPDTPCRGREPLVETLDQVAYETELAAGVS